MAVPTPSYSGIPYPAQSSTSTSVERRNSFVGVRPSLQLSSQSVVPASVVFVDRIDQDQQMLSLGGSQFVGPQRDRSDSIRSVDFHDALPAKRVNQMDMEFQRLKVYDSRKRPQSQNFEDSNGAFYSNYISQRIARVVEDYRRTKYEDARLTSQMGIPSQEQLQLRRASSLNLAQRSGSFTNLAMSQSTRTEEYGPVEQVEWFSRENSREHRTDRYDITQSFKGSYPVYRRGQPFFFAIRLASRNMDLARNPVFVTFNFGSNPSIGKCTRVSLTINGEREFMQRDKSDWDIRIHHQDGNTLTLQVNVPATAPVGQWRCEIQHNNDIFQVHEDIYILFNPFCSEDPAYMDNEQFRREYVFGESGKIYRGTYKNVKTYKWIYNQFSDIILPMVTLFLDRFTEQNRNILDYSQRGSPVFVSRALAALIYSKFGVFKEPENREENFSTFNYSGTYAIFEKILEQNFRPVETDQTFLASAVYVTFCRALGLPCRSVTSYRAPLEKTSLNVDVYWVEENERESDLYHAYQCWNDVWMRRDDLVSQSSYLGWQAVDPNNRGYGPSPAEAVRRGEVGLNFDISYFYSLLNSQFRHFYTNNFPERIIQDDIGRLIVTKRCDRDDDVDDDFEDITLLYKKKDSTEDERLMVMNALKGNSQPTRRGSLSLRTRSASIDKTYIDDRNRRKDDIFAEFNYSPASFGQNVPVTLLIQNTSNEMRTIVVNLFARPLYQGVVGRKIKQIRRQFTLQPNQRESFNLELNPQEYQDRLDEDYIIRYFACIYTRETNNFWAGDEDITLSKPRLNIQMRPSAQVDNDVQVSFTLVNPLSVSLTDCYIFYEAAGFAKPMFRRIKDIKPGEMLNLNETLIPRKGGDARLVAIFNSRQLRNVSGSKMITVRE